jgi:alanyl-tRNA synthetase
MHKDHLTSATIRDRFFAFFTKRGHTHVPSSSLIPAQDPTLLFTNAGMNQFKDVFLGKEKRSYTRAVTIQKCLRAGGKHNDLDNVGFTQRHLTFFEMMGNFSFGDYFKREAIRYAWDFLTQEMHLPSDKLYATVYEKDDEAYALWQEEVGIDPRHISRLGAADNFWQMGDTGPCGPSSEIYIDRGAAFGCGAGVCAPGCHCDRFLEIWNLVFMQYDRQPDGTDLPLSHKGVDTGMGLERLCTIVQQKESVFDTDLFTPIIAYIEQHTGHRYSTAQPDIQVAFRVLADHIRSSAFALADGCTPSNEGRGYVLRKIIRRAALFQQKLTDKNIFPELVVSLTTTMGMYYPELIIHQESSKTILTNEIERFIHNLGLGKTIFAQYAAQPATQAHKQISGVQAFKLYDTFGFPLELTKVLAHEQGLTVDVAAFDEEMEKQRIRSGKKEAHEHQVSAAPTLSTTFVGYRELVTDTVITALFIDSTPVTSTTTGQQCWLTTETSPFFVECGGQISDTGSVIVAGYVAAVDHLKKSDHAILVQVKAPVDLHVGMPVTLSVDAAHRLNTMKNHTATHLLQAALIELLGKQVHQSGSLVDPDYLRFDFTYHENLTPDQITRVEQRVNEKIMENIPLNIYITDYATALSQGVIAIFGEKYNPEEVRVIDVPGFSKELCGGTHVRATGDIGCFKITEVSALSAGNRRIFAVTGPKAIELFQTTFNTIKGLSQTFKTKPTQLAEAIKKQQDSLKECSTHLKETKKKLWNCLKPTWLQQMSTINGVPVLYLPLKENTPDELREIVQELMKTQQGLYILTIPQAEQMFLMASVTPQQAAQVDMVALLAWLKTQGFHGGGNKITLQGTLPYKDQRFINELTAWLSTTIKESTSG